MKLTPETLATALAVLRSQATATALVIEALAERDAEIALLKSKLALADALRNRAHDRGLSVGAQDRIADWECRTEFTAPRQGGLIVTSFVKETVK